MEFHYRLKEDNTVAITEISQPEPLIEIPGELDGHTVTELDENFVPFGVKTTVREVILPETIKKINSRAFNDMRYLKKLTLPEGLEEIAEYGIFTCPDLLDLHIPQSVTTLGQYAFGYMYEHGRTYGLRYFASTCKENSTAHRFVEENNLKYTLV